MKSAKGFTLVELMIAISILSILLFTGSYLYSTLSSRWDQELGHFNESMKTSRAFNIIQQLLDGTMAYVVTENEQSDSRPSYFFVGTRESLLGMSRQGIYSTEYPEIFRLSAVRQEDDTFDLVFQAKSTQGFLLTGTHQEVEFDYERTLVKGLDDILFGYYGHESFSAKNNADESAPLPEPVWNEAFSGVERQLMPQKLGLIMVKGDKRFSFVSQLDTNSQRFIEHYMSDQTES